jgi:hypothetical protein
VVTRAIYSEVLSNVKARPWPRHRHCASQTWPRLRNTARPDQRQPHQHVLFDHEEQSARGTQQLRAAANREQAEREQAHRKRLGPGLLEHEEASWCEQEQGGHERSDCAALERKMQAPVKVIAASCE